MKKITAFAGGRIDFAGGWGDGCTLIDPKGEYVLGRVCNVGLELGSQVEITSFENEGVHIVCNGFDEILNEEMDYGGDLDLFLAAIKRFGLNGLEIKAHSHIPYGSGLGGSAAMAVPLTAAIFYAIDFSFRKKAKDGPLPYALKEKIAEEARALEIEEMDISSGWQDQWAAAFGGVNYIYAENDPQKPKREEIFNDKKSNKALENNLLLVYTPKNKKTRRSSSAQHKNVQKIAKLELLSDIARQGEKAQTALRKLDFKILGQVVFQAWETIKQFTNNSASSAQIDWLIKKTMDYGAYGAKACGAGGPGTCVVIIANKKTQDKIKKMIVKKQGYKILPVKISTLGLQVGEN